MTFDIDALDLVPQTTTDELADLADVGLARCVSTCIIFASCWITIVI